MVIWDLSSSRMNMNDSSSQYIQQFLASTQNSDGSLVLKSEEDGDYNAALPFLTSDCSYLCHQNSPSDQQPQTQQHYTTMQSPSSTFSSAIFNASACSPTNQISQLGNLNPMNYGQRLVMGSNVLGTNIEQLPDTTIFPGDFDFQLSLGPHTETATKSADFTYSPELKKLYVQKGAQCPFKFKTNCQPPPNSYVKILPVFKGTHVLSEPVRRCSNHAEGDDEGNRYHFIRANNRSTRYDTSSSGRFYLTIPYTGPQVGAEYQIELLSFMCFNSCGQSSHSKRKIDVIFMLESNGQVLGRQVIEVRVCACPGRDRTNEESPTSRNSSKVVRKISHSSGQGRGGKRRKLSSTIGEEEFTIKTSNPLFHQILQQILDTLESQLPASLLTDIIPSISNPSPVSTASSPGNVFKPIHENDNLDDDLS